MSGDIVETLLAAYLLLGPVGAAVGMIIITWRWLRPRTHEGRIAATSSGGSVTRSPRPGGRDTSKLAASYARVTSDI
ncbi:MAG TPA: hypothetical protein VKK19_16625 [Candidatus Dormibacteraeota bacterium]|nr:hypothetical protein [Candidatus Dormibacteraeota bacterium]